MTLRQKVKQLRNCFFKLGANTLIPLAQKRGVTVRPTGHFSCVENWADSRDCGEGEDYLEYDKPVQQHREIPDYLLNSDLGDIFSKVESGNTTRQFRMVLRNAWVYDMRAVVVHQTNRIFSEITYEYGTKAEHFSFWNRVSIPPVTACEDRLGVAHSVSADNYAHWVMEVVPQLIRLKEDLAAGHIDKIYVRLEKSFQREWIDLIGISQDALIPAENGKHIRADEMVVYSMPMRNCEFSKDQLELFQSLVKPEWKRKVARKIFIGREGGTRSFNLSDGNVKDVVEDCGYEYVLMENYSVLDKIQYFAESSVIAGLHGGGFGGIVFSDRGTELREIHSPLIPNLCYWRIASSNSMKYHTIYAEVSKDDLQTKGIQKPLTLSEAKLRHFLMENIHCDHLEDKN